MAQSFDYTNKPIIFCATEEGTVSTASTTVARWTFVAPTDMYLDRVSMAVGAVGGGGAGYTEVSVSKNTLTTGRLFSTNTLQIAHNSSTAYASITRSSLNSTGLAKVSRGDRLLVYVRELPTTASTHLTVSLTSMGA